MTMTVLIFLWDVNQPVKYVEKVEKCTGKIYTEMVDKYRPDSIYKSIVASCVADKVL